MTDLREKRRRQFEQLAQRYAAGEWSHFDLSAAQCLDENHAWLVGASESDSHSTARAGRETHFCTVGAMEAALDHTLVNPLVLVFASAKNPGGGVANGAVAQEEDISLRSTWYFQARASKGFYLAGHASPDYTNRLLYTQRSLMLQDAHHRWLPEPKALSFVAAAAPNYAAIKAQGLPIEDADVREMLCRRTRLVLNLAHHGGHDAIVLGAWGTGVFKNPDEWVAEAFRQAIHESPFSGRIVFAIPDAHKLELFRQLMTEPARSHENQSIKSWRP